MQLETSRCYAQIDLDALAENRRLLRAGIPEGCRLMYILKADGYGHGAVAVAKALERDAGADWIGVACLSEALELRRAGITREVLILGYTPPEFAAELAENNITQALISPAYVARLSQVAQEKGVTVPCHMAVDTGMSRIGYLYGTGDPAQELEAIAGAYRMPGLRITGIFTHFSSGYSQEREDVEFTQMQYDRFAAVCQGLAGMGIDPGLRHCCNSPATVNCPQYAMDMCRVGTVLYGLLPDTAMVTQRPFIPVMTWKARVAMVKEVQPGAYVSYNRTYQVQGQPVRLAVITAGDADGYFKLLSGGLGRVKIRGHVCQVVGRVCMDMMMVDVTAYPGIRAEDEVILLGGQGEDRVPCEWLFRPLSPLGPSAITCSVRGRVPRLYSPVND